MNIVEYDRPVLLGLRLRFEKLSVTGIYLEVPLQFRVVQAFRQLHFFEKGSRDSGHRSAHSRLAEALCNRGMARKACTRADIAVRVDRCCASFGFACRLVR